MHDLSVAALIVHVTNTLSVFLEDGWDGFHLAEAGAALATGLYLVVWHLGDARWRPSAFSMVVLSVITRWCASWSVGDEHFVYTSVVSCILYLPFLVPIGLLMGMRPLTFGGVALCVSLVGFAGSFRTNLVDTPVSAWHIGPAVFVATLLLIGFGRRWVHHLDALKSTELRAQGLSLEIQTHAARQLSLRMESIEQFGGAMAHELNNLLAVVQPLSIELRAALDGDLRQHAEDIFQSSERAKKLGGQLLMLTRQSEGVQYATDLVEAAREWIEALNTSTPGTPVRVDLPSGPLPVALRTDEAHSLLYELITNAREAAGPNGEVSVCLREDDVAKQGDHSAQQRMVELVVADDGHGIPEALTAKVLQPFVSTRDQPGRGLGLTTVLAIVLRGGGSIRLENRSSGGVQVNVRLPISRSAAQAHRTPAPVSTPPPSPTSTETPETLRILLVDDEQMILRATRRMLQGEGVEVQTTQSPYEALELLHQSPARFDVVVTDVRMPGMTGPELAKAARSQLTSPPPFLFITGHIDTMTAETAGLTPEDILYKPFSSDALLTRIHQVRKRTLAASGSG